MNLLDNVAAGDREGADGLALEISGGQQRMIYSSSGAPEVYRHNFPRRKGI